jgi:hypothetical protein
MMGLQRVQVFQCNQRRPHGPHPTERNDLAPRPRQGRPERPDGRAAHEKRVGQTMGYSSEDEACWRVQVTDADALGSKSVPVFSIACRITASLRASTTAARLKPKRFFSAKPHRRRSLSVCTRVRMTAAAS